jgi:hypothetical protein
MPAPIRAAVNKARFILRIVTSVSKITAGRRDSVSDRLSFGVERPTEFVATNSWGKSARRIPISERQGAPATRKLLQAKNYLRRALAQSSDLSVLGP